MSGRYDIEIEQGATWSRTVTYEAVDETPVDLTGYTARMMIRSAYDAPMPLVSLTSGAGGIAIDAGAGRLTLTMSATQTAALPAGRHVYDLELVVGGTVERLLEGRARVTPEVTR